MSFNQRALEYAGSNFGFGIHYDKIYKKEYLPSRIRYSQFYFYSAFFGLSYFLLSKKNGGGMFAPQEGSVAPSGNLSESKYYTSDRAVVNPLMIIYNS